jgi:protein-disulfide isomerase
LIRSIFAVAALSLAVAPWPSPPWRNRRPPKAPAKLAAGARRMGQHGGHHPGGNAATDAPIKLVEYMSYTCPHCAHFEAEGVKTMR